MTKTSMRLSCLALAGVLLLGSAAGTAAAKGKIKGKQIAPNAIATKHLKAGAVTGDKLADGSVTGAKVQAGAVTGDKLAANTVTGAQVDEASLGRVPDAAAIAGQTVTPIAMDLPNTQPSAVTVATGPGWTLGLDCATSKTSLLFLKAGTSSLVTTVFTAETDPPLLSVHSSGDSLSTAASIFEFRLVSMTGGTATTVVELTGAFSAGQFGAQKDCYYRGTVTTTP